ncbi:TlpA family protein disulfide reductase [Chitinophagaceae bacterium MMS25-I14]
MSKTLICILCLLTALTQKSLAQKTTTDSLYVGKTISDKDFDEMRHRSFLKNTVHTGRKYEPFLAHALDGGIITNDSLKGKVCLLAFWYPSCGCFNLEQLKEITAHFKDNPAFSLMIVTFETTGLNEYMTAHKLTFPVATVRYMNDAQKMNFHNGFPSFVLLNKAGITTRVNGLEGFSASEYIDAIAHLLM